MDLELVPLFGVQRDLYRIPRGIERFRAYIRVLRGAHPDDIDVPPLVTMNPMAKDHVPELLDEWMALGAEKSARELIPGLALSTIDASGRFRIGMVVADDARGGWTNRWSTDYGLRFDMGPCMKRDWLTVAVWSSEPADLERALEEVRIVVHRAAHVVRHGRPETLRERMEQEGRALSAAGAAQPALDPDDIAYTREVVAPFLDEKDPTQSLVCLFGDVAAQSLGHAALGLSPSAGIALALHDARAQPKRR